MPTYTRESTANLSSEIVVFTPEMAKAWRTDCLFDRQRPINTDHVARLAEEMKKGYFLAGTPIWVCVYANGSMKLVNGNHTLEAVIKSGVAIPLTVVYQKVRSDNETALAYGCFDIQRTRTWMQAAKAIELDKKVPLTQKVLTALPYIMADFKPHANGYGPTKVTSSRIDRFAAAKEYTQAAHLLQTCLAGTPKVNQNLAMRGGLVAVALVTLRYQPSMAEEFWAGFIMDDGLKGGDPRKALLRYNQNTTVGAAGFNVIRAAAMAWNAWFSKKQLDRIGPSDLKAMQQVRILGTPWATDTKQSAQTKKAIAVPEMKTKTIIGQKMNSIGRPVPVVVRVPEARMSA